MMKTVEAETTQLRGPSTHEGSSLMLQTDSYAPVRFNAMKHGILSSLVVLAHENHSEFDDLLAALRPRGLPIGNLTSQFWANVYLDRLDHFVKRELKCPAYLRYVDDFLLFADDKPTLWAWRRAIIDYLAGLRLTLHEARCHPQPVTEGIPFLGFVIYPDHRLLKRRKGIAYRRRLRVLVGDYRARRIPLARVTASVQGWVNHARYADTYGLRKALLRQALAK